MVRFGAIAVGAGLALGFVPSMGARAQAPPKIPEVMVDTATARIVVTGHDFTGKGLLVTLGEIGDITRACSLQATSPQTVGCDLSRPGPPPAGGSRVTFPVGGARGEAELPI